MSSVDDLIEEDEDLYKVINCPLIGKLGNEYVCYETMYDLNKKVTPLTSDKNTVLKICKSCQIIKKEKIQKEKSENV